MTAGTVQNPNHYTGLVEDCEILLEFRDELAGTRHLNWEIGSNIATWDGITVSGAPLRVSKLQLYDSRLTGTIPPKLGKTDPVTGVGTLQQRADRGDPGGAGSTHPTVEAGSFQQPVDGKRFPPGLGQLIRLEQLYLNLNQLKGAIPRELSQLNRLGTLCSTTTN